MTLYALGDIEPQIDPDAFVHPDCTIIGNVVIAAGATIWPQAVLRGDQSRIVIGARTSVQDGAVIHCTRELETTSATTARSVISRTSRAAPSRDGALDRHRIDRVAPRDRAHRRARRRGARSCPNGMEVPSGAMALGVPAKLREGAVEA